MEVKVTLEAGQSLIDLVNTLLQGLFRQTLTPAAPTEKKAKKQPKPEPAVEPQPEPMPEPMPETTEAPTEVLQVNDTAPTPAAIDYTKLRAEIRTLAAQKRAAGQDVNVILKKRGGKLSAIADADLPAVKAEIEAM